ncbi:MAG: neutral/alkaline non-lysosomal ceramidase N-terminal domain-containing protein [Mangrovibacterium sp.]
MKDLTRYMMLAIVCMFAGCSSSPDQLRCNIGVADITPEEHVVLAGFAAREGLSTTIHRPLKTHCMVIENDSARVCIISNDMMEISINTANSLREEIAAQTGIPRDHIFIHCTHTHSAPRAGGSSTEKGGTNYAFAKKFRETVVKNAVQTANNREAFIPFTIETGKGESDINCNRGEKGGPCNHDVYLARLLDRKGKTIVSLLNFACHPVSLNSRSLVVSTDFPGITVEALSKEWGSDVFYFSGAAGNVDPCGALRADTSYTQAKGMELADAVRNIRTEKIERSNILRMSNREVKLPFRVSGITPEIVNAHADEIKQWNVSGTWKNDVERWRSATLEKIGNGEVKNYLPFEIAGINLGRLVLFFSQGEPFNEYQTILRASNPGIPLFFIAYTNGQNSYLPSKYAFERDAYKYEKEQMHIYIGAPYPLSDEMPVVYETAIKQVVNDVIGN